MLILFILFILFLVIISILKSNGLGDSFFQLFQDIPYHDKVGHFILMGILGFLVIAVVSPALKNKFSNIQSITLPALFVLLLIGFEELSQQYLSTRSCTWSDFLFGALGVLLSTGIHLLIQRRKEVF